MTGRKDDHGKPRYDLVPVEALDQVVRVLTFGAEKYGDHNWSKVTDADLRYFSAAQRHLWAYRSAVLAGDEDGRFDHESGRHHLAHAISCLLFMLELDTDELKAARLKYRLVTDCTMDEE